MPLETVPDHQHLSQVRDWLEREQEEAGYSFMCNWATIDRAYDRQEMFCWLEEGQAVAFFTWCGYDHDAVLHSEIVVVRPDCRGQGVGRAMMQAVYGFLRQERGTFVLHLECMPARSEPF